MAEQERKIDIDALKTEYDQIRDNTIILLGQAMDAVHRLGDIKGVVLLEEADNIDFRFYRGPGGMENR